MGLRLYINKKKLIYGCILLVVMFVFMTITSAIRTNNNFITYAKNVTPLILMVCIVQLLGLSLLLPKKRIIMYAVIVLYYIFHTSHVILNAIGYDFGSNERNNIFFRFPADTCIEATNTAIVAGVCLYIGIVLYYMFYNCTDNWSKRGGFLTAKGGNVPNTFLIYTLLALGLLGDLAMSISAIFTSRMYGYLAVGEAVSSLTYLTRLISYLLVTGVVLYIQSDNIALSKKKAILTAFCIYKLVSMLSGLRAYSLINIMIVLYVYYRTNIKTQKFKFKYVIIALIVIQLGGGFIVGIRETRLTGVDFQVLLQYMFDIKSNIIFNMMSEFGITQNVLCAIHSKINGAGNHLLQLISSIILIVPGASFFFPNYDFTNRILETNLNIHNYGGTYIGDVLFDFGKNGMAVGCVLLGVFFAALYEKYEYELQHGNSLYIAIVSPIIVEFIYCVRSSMAKMPRMIVWYLLLMLIVNIVTKGQIRFDRKK